MTLLIAFIRPDCLPAIQAALDRTVACFVSATPMESHGPEPTMTGSFRGGKFRIRRVQLRLDVAVDDEFAEAAARAIVDVFDEVDLDGIAQGEVYVVRADEMHDVGFGN